MRVNGAHGFPSSEAVEPPLPTRTTAVLISAVRYPRTWRTPPSSVGIRYRVGRQPTSAQPPMLAPVQLSERFPCCPASVVTEVLHNRRRRFRQAVWRRCRTDMTCADRLHGRRGVKRRRVPTGCVPGQGALSFPQRPPAPPDDLPVLVRHVVRAHGQLEHVCTGLRVAVRPQDAHTPAGVAVAILTGPGGPVRAVSR